jgi:hypothetical protein
MYCMEKGDWMPGYDLGKEIFAKMESEGFSCEENMSLGPLLVTFYGSKVVRYGLLPYSLHYYVFQLPSELQPNLQYVFGLHALARGFTNNFKNTGSKWYRFRVPITVTLIISQNGYDENTILKICSRKQPYQMGDCNTIVLVDASKMRLYNLDKVGFVGSLPLKRVNKYTFSLLEEIVHNKSAK